MKSNPRKKKTSEQCFSDETKSTCQNPGLFATFFHPNRHLAWFCLTPSISRTICSCKLGYNLFLIKILFFPNWRTTLSVSRHLQSSWFLIWTLPIFPLYNRFKLILFLRFSNSIRMSSSKFWLLQISVCSITIHCFKLGYNLFLIVVFPNWKVLCHRLYFFKTRERLPERLKALLQRFCHEKHIPKVVFGLRFTK